MAQTEPQQHDVDALVQANSVQYHPCADIIGQTKRLTTVILSYSSWVPVPQVVEKPAKAICDISAPYVNTLASSIDRRIDSTIKRGGQFLKMTKQSLYEKLYNDEHLIIVFLRTWILSHWPGNSLNLKNASKSVSLQDFIAQLQAKGFQAISLDKIKEKIRVFYEIASAAWSKFVTQKSASLKNVVLEITSSSLCFFNEIKNDGAFLKTLVQMGDVILDDTKGEIKAENLLEKVHETLPDGEKVKEKSSAYEDVVNKYYNILVKFRSIINASENFNPTNLRWVQFCLQKGEETFTYIENSINKLHAQVVVSASAPAPQQSTTQSKKSKKKAKKAAAENNGQEHNGENGESNGVHEESNGNGVHEYAIVSKKVNGKGHGEAVTHYQRVIVMVVKLNEVRRAVQQLILDDPKIVIRTIKDLKDSLNVVQNMAKTIDYVTAASLKAVDTVYLPLSAYAVQLTKSPKAIALRVYVGERTDQVIKALEKSETFRRVRDQITVIAKDQTVKFQLKYDSAKKNVADLYKDLQQVALEVVGMLKEREERKKIPSKVYQRALEMYKKRTEGLNPATK